MTLNAKQQLQAEHEARDKILGLCPPVIVKDETWYNIFWQGHNVQWEIKFLRMQGKLKHHPTNQSLIHLKE